CTSRQHSECRVGTKGPHHMPEEDSREGQEQRPEEQGQRCDHPEVGYFAFHSLVHHDQKTRTKYGGRPEGDPPEVEAVHLPSFMSRLNAHGTGKLEKWDREDRLTGCLVGVEMA